jgi:hypothetical protein
VDRGGDDGRARLERQPPDAALGLLGELAGARAAALAVHDDQPAALEMLLAVMNASSSR